MHDNLIKSGKSKSADGLKRGILILRDASGGAKTMAFRKSILVGAPTKSILLALALDGEFRVFYGDKPSYDTYQKCFEGGHSAYRIEDLNHAVEIPSSLYQLDGDIFYPILDVDGDVVSGGGVFVQLLHGDRYPNFATVYFRDQHLSVGCELSIDVWANLNLTAIAR
jgi:hypothetical protein